MKNKKLYDCLSYIENWETLNAEDHAKCFGKSLAFVEPFKKEILENLIDLKDHQQQVNLIKYYIVEIFNTANTDFIRSIRDSYVNDKGELLQDVQIVNLYGEDDDYVYEIIRLLGWLFMEIDYCCWIYKIPLDKLLEDQGIDLHLFFSIELQSISDNIEDTSLPDERPIKETQPEQKKDVEVKPVFKPEAIQTIFDQLKGFFKPEQQTQLLDILKTGNTASDKLKFMDNGNRLTDTFKKLIEYGFITGCSKKVLQDWICLNFMFVQGNLTKSYNLATVERTLSGNQNPCKNPLIQIVNGSIINDPHPRQNKSNNY